MGIADRISRALIGRPVVLPPELLQLFPELREARFRAGGVLPRVGGWPLGLRSVAAVTIWRTVFLARGVALHPELLLHEVRHVHQFEASRAFPFAYIWECVRRGYRNNRYEVDARSWASARVRKALLKDHPGDL